ncbi:MAG: ABC-2 family transporter protein [bacterium]|nr:ABC-2 family transporter protein [bacterium]
MVNNLLKYLKITLILIKNCFSKETAFRLPFLFWVIANLIWLWFSLYSVEILFSQVPVIAGWTARDGKVLILVHQIFSTLIWFFIMPNLVVFWKLINQGTLDFHLLKPVSARFLSSATYFEFDMIPRLIPIILIFLPLIKTLPYALTFIDWFVFFAVLLLGVVIFYNFGFIVVTTCFWFTKIDSLEDFFATGTNIGKYPSDIFKGVAKIMFVYVIPSTFIAVIPSMILLGKGGYELLLLCLIFACGTSVLSQWFWNFALKYYSSASS